MPELLETKEFDGYVLTVEVWARDIIKKHTGHASEQGFHGARPLDLADLKNPIAGPMLLQLDPGDETEDLVKPGQHVAALLDRGVEGPLVSFVKAGAWCYGHNLAGYLPEADVYTVAEWSDAAEGYRTMVERYCSDADEANFDFAESQAERLFDGNDGQDDRIPEFPDTPSMYPRAKQLLADTPMVEGKGYLIQLPDHSRRTIEFWLRWEKTAVPDELVED